MGLYGPHPSFAGAIASEPAGRGACGFLQMQQQKQQKPNIPRNTHNTIKPPPSPDSSSG
jgi:hypothetical protein